MPIKIKHDPSAAAIGESAYTIGRGEKMRWATDIGLRQQALDLQGRSIRAQAKSRAAAIEQREEESERLHGLREEELEFRKEQQQEEMGLKLQMRLDAQKRLREEKTIYEYTPGQLKALEKINNGRTTAEKEFAEGKWKPEEMENITRQFDRLERLIIPQGRLNTERTQQEIFNSGIVKHPMTGAEYWVNPKTGNPEALGSSYKESSDFYIDVAKLFTIEDEISGKKTVDWEGVDEFVRKAEGRIAQRQGLSARAEEIQARQAQEEQALQEQEQQQEQQAERQAAVEALPVMFERIISGQPKIGRKKKGKPSSDMVYGEEAYNKTLIEAVGRGEQDGIPPDVVKAELDKWWDAQYDKERGERFQKFKSRMGFEGAAGPQSQEEFIRTIQGMDDKKEAKAYYDKWISKWQ